MGDQQRSLPDTQDAFPSLPWGYASRLHPWLWTAVVQICGYDNPAPRMKRIVAEGPTEEDALKGLWAYYERGYSGTGDWVIIAPTEAPRTFKTWEDVHAAAVPIPITLYTVDCPICGVDCVETESDYGSVDDHWEYLGYHLDNHHSDMPRDADELAEREVAVTANV